LSQARTQRFWSGKTNLKGKYLLIAFGFLGVFSAFVYPFIFAGVHVYLPKVVAIDDGFFYRPPLQFSFSNIAQAVYLVLDVLVVFAAASARKSNKARSLYDLAFYGLAGLVFVQFLCLYFGISFPYSLFQNNPGYLMATATGQDLAVRVMGTFTEPSGAGMMLALFFAGYFYEYFSGTGSVLKPIIAAVSIGLVRSSSSLAAMLAVTALIPICRPFFRYPWFVRPARLAKVVGVLTVATLIVLSPLSTMLREYTTDKSETLSYVHRTAADVFSLQLAADTHWIGVGLGSHRPSSLLASLLSTMGVLGLIIFLLMLIQIARNVTGEHLWIRWAILAVLVDMCLGGPDITQPTLWIVLALAAHYGTVERNQEGVVLV
jgi:hypothetical protein